MKDTEYKDLLEFQYRGAYIPINEKARELADRSKMGSSYFMKEVEARDIKFHRCYFGLLNYIWQQLPIKFQQAVDQKNFYKFIKHLKGQYKEVYKFKDGTTFIEYDSISFGRMSQKKFEEYVAEQMPFIYENVIMECYDHEKGSEIINEIEKEYEKFLQMLV